MAILGEQMLGREYSVAGTVIRGDQLGRKLGFPTANLDVSGLVLPPNGVYAVHARVANREHRGALNLGLRPTLASSQPTLQCEVHLLDFNEEIYRQHVSVKFLHMLRGQEKYDSMDALRVQIAQDVVDTRNYFAKYHG